MTDPTEPQMDPPDNQEMQMAAMLLNSHLAMMQNMPTEPITDVYGHMIITYVAFAIKYCPEAWQKSLQDDIARAAGESNLPAVTHEKITDIIDKGESN